MSPVYCSLFHDIIIELVSKDSKAIFTRERRHPPKAKMMTICSLQETLIKLDLLSAYVSASFQEGLKSEELSLIWRRGEFALFR